MTDHAWMVVLVGLAVCVVVVSLAAYDAWRLKRQAERRRGLADQIQALSPRDLDHLTLRLIQLQSPIIDHLQHQLNLAYEEHIKICLRRGCEHSEQIQTLLSKVVFPHREERRRR